MNKKVLSFIVILCTIFSVIIMLFSDKIIIRKELPKDRIEVINNSNNLNNETVAIENKKSTINDGQNNRSKEENLNTNTADSYNKLKLNENNKLKVEKDSSLKSNDSGNAKSVKNTNKQITRELDSSGKNVPSKEQGDGANNVSDSSKEDIPVFKISRWKVKDSLTLLDKEKLLSIAGKLSAIDYEKITQYLQNGSDEDIKNTIKLLRERLSDKDYKKVREVAEKFINMDVVER